MTLSSWILYRDFLRLSLKLRCMIVLLIVVCFILNIIGIKKAKRGNVDKQEIRHLNKQTCTMIATSSSGQVLERAPERMNERPTC